MTLDGKTMASGDLNLKLFDTRILEFNNLATHNTDQVIVVLVVITCFVACLTITKMALLGNAAFGKKFQGTVNRCITDTRILPA
jgi:hypothetical protein